ncbi:MAG TPA: FG-GAP-like repeat-containing protein, partial [Planctomycetota bacterium]|nr:FG-GAP-like repeat-containing protein [Planctomycetota bacterium]
WFRDAANTSSILGFDLAIAGDLDGDGVRDVIASAPFGDNTTGLVFVYSGRTGATLHTFVGAAINGDFGYCVATGGDYDGDGIQDVAIADDGDPAVRANGGRVFVFSGAGYGLLQTIDPPPGGFLFGTSLAFVGDVDGDGRDELAIGDRLTTTGSTGRMHLIGFDGTANVVHWTVSGLEFGSPIDGNKFAGGGDVDGDGIPDVIADESFPAHRARLFSGANGAVLHTFTDLGNDEMGKGAKIVPDQNHDGVPDLLMGAPNNSTRGQWNGRVVLFSGRDFRRLRQITCTTATARFGADCDLLPDVDGDGWPELLVGAAGASGFVRSMGGVHLIAGDPLLAGWSNQGAGLAGTLGVPSLRAGSDPVLGGTFALGVGNPLGSPTLCLLAMGLGVAAQPTPWGGMLLVDPLSLLAVPLPAGGLTLPVALPGDPVLLGLLLRGQSFVLDGGAIQGVAESLRLDLQLGR